MRRKDCFSPGPSWSKAAGLQAPTFLCGATGPGTAAGTTSLAGAVPSVESAGRSDRAHGGLAHGASG